MLKQYKFLTLTQDVIFKNFFSSDKRILLSLLRTFLPVSDEVSDVSILNPETDQSSDVATIHPDKTNEEVTIKDSSLHPHVPDGKSSVLDLRVQLKNGEKINVEMQTISQSYFLKRVLFYWARLYSTELKRGQNYGYVKLTYSLVFTDFTVLEEETDCINRFSIRSDKLPHKPLSGDLRIVIVELNKLNKACRELIDLKEKWCYLLRYSNRLTAEEQKYLSKEKEINMALEHLDELSREERLFQQEWDRKKAEWDWNSNKAAAIEEGMKEGMEKGIERGVHQVALNMLQEGIELSVISKVTGLSETEINQLKK